MKTKDNVVKFRASDDFVFVMNKIWKLFRLKYPEYNKVNNLSQFIVCALLNEINKKEQGQVIINDMNDNEIPELYFWKTNDSESEVEKVLKEIKEKIKNDKKE